MWQETVYWLAEEGQLGALVRGQPDLLFFQRKRHPLANDF